VKNSIVLLFSLPCLCHGTVRTNLSYITLRSGESVINAESLTATTLQKYFDSDNPFFYYLASANDSGSSLEYVTHTNDRQGSDIKAESLIVPMGKQGSG